MKHAVSLAAASLLAMSTAACASPQGGVELQRVRDPVSFQQAERDADGQFAGRPAVQRIRVPGNFFVSQPRDGQVPASLLNRRVDIDIRSETPTLSDLQTLLDIQNVAVTLDWRSLQAGSAQNAEVGSFTAASRYQGVTQSVSGGAGVQQNTGFGNIGGQGTGFQNQSGSSAGSGGRDSNVEIEGTEEAAEQRQQAEIPTAELIKRFNDRPLPFRQFRGTVGELIRRLESTGNIAVWYDGGLVMGDVRRYSVSILQNRDMTQAIVNELIRLGAVDVVGSVGAGQVFYSAPPRTNAEIIEPYLRRLSGNLSEVTLQVALVTVAMSRDAERGFDWSAFDFSFGRAPTEGTPGAPVVPGQPTTPGTPGTPGTGDFFTLNNGGFNLGVGALNIFGASQPLTIAGAIRFLSTMGETSVAQNVELRTLSGAPVELRSGESIPYVSGVGSNFAGGLGSGIAQNAQTERLGTGLTINVDPRYDHTSGIVTLDVGMKLVDLVEFVQLQAGNQLGTLTQPRTREQGVNSIVRLPAGQTAVLGGIRRDLTSDSRTGPLGAFGIGSRNRQREVFWLFAIIRPVVTVYETADAPVAPRSVLDTRTTVNPLDAGSYGEEGVPSPAVPVYGNPQTPGRGEAPTYYREEGAVTPANRRPSGVVVSAPPAVRNVVVPGAATQPEVNAGIPEGAVLRDPVGTPRNAPASPVQNVPQAPAPAPVQVQPAPPPQAPAQRRSFVRPMTDAEREGNK